MIRDLDDTLQELLETRAPPGSELEGAEISFELPDADWRTGLDTLTVNCYLYDLRENEELRTNEPLLLRSADGTRAVRLRPPPSELTVPTASLAGAPPRMSRCWRSTDCSARCWRS